MNPPGSGESIKESEVISERAAERDHLGDIGEHVDIQPVEQEATRSHACDLDIREIDCTQAYMCNREIRGIRLLQKQSEYSAERRIRSLIEQNVSHQPIPDSQ
jgi:hypothetical protein